MATCSCGAESGDKKTCERCRLMVANAALRLRLGIGRMCGCGKASLGKSERRCGECVRAGRAPVASTLESLRAEHATLRSKLSEQRAAEAKKKFQEDSRKAALAQSRARR